MADFQSKARALAILALTAVTAFSLPAVARVTPAETEGLGFPFRRKQACLLPNR